MRSLYGDALISEYKHRGWRERVRLIANYDYRGICSINALWHQVHDLAMLSMVDGEQQGRDYRQLAINSPKPFGPLA